MPGLATASHTATPSTSARCGQHQLPPGYRAQRLTLPANEVTVLHLPPDHGLLGLEGRIELEYGGLLWGQLLQPQQRTLNEGEWLAGAQDGMAAGSSSDRVARSHCKCCCSVPSPSPGGPCVCGERCGRGWQHGPLRRTAPCTVETGWRRRIKGRLDSGSATCIRLLPNPPVTDSGAMGPAGPAQAADSGLHRAQAQ
jgi:hypothetical protein